MKYPDPMMDIEHSLNVYKHLSGRAVLPLLPSPDSLPGSRPPNLPDLANVQGDIVYLFPKKAENFIFFRIKDVRSFKDALKSFKPTTSEEIKHHLKDICDVKEASGHSKTHWMIEKAQYQISFTRGGLNLLNVLEETGDARFDHRCMRDDKEFLGDRAQWDYIFEKPNFNSSIGSVKDDRGAIHGLITVAGISLEHCERSSSQVLKLFGTSITVNENEGILKGNARPPPYKGHEHFGFKDGISQPALRGLIVPRPGQIQVDPGVILMGYPGDPVLDNPNAKQRPSWTKDGSILVFRKLEQDVIGFENYLALHGRRWREFIPGRDESHNLSDAEGAELFGAQLIGRWKSGAPLAMCPFRDNPTMAKDPEKNNDFDYAVRNNPTIWSNQPSNYYCPFTAHTRKTAPRNLDPYISTKYLESGSIVRGGLPYGPEVTANERQCYDPNKPSPRGLMFSCYMSSLDSGFVRQTTGYACNDFFPPTSLIPKQHGQDPILGGPPILKDADIRKKAHDDEASSPIKDGDQIVLTLSGTKGKEIEVIGFAKVRTKGTEVPPGEPQRFFVSSRGGEYFFVPSISALKTWASS